MSENLKTRSSKNKGGNMLFKIKSILMIFFVSLTSVACQSNGLTDDQNMTVAEFKEAIKTDTNLVILDVRTPAELEGPLGKIDGVINIPVQDLNNRISELDPMKNNTIAVICRSGNRSVSATKILSEYGFKAKNVKGGMRAYNDN
jgi:rhodanese-related sulfurtransferase